jgi:hypothetical protein
MGGFVTEPGKAAPFGRNPPFFGDSSAATPKRATKCKISKHHAEKTRFGVLAVKIIFAARSIFLDAFLLRYILRIIAAHKARLCGRKNHGADCRIYRWQHWVGRVVLGSLRGDGGLK